MQTERSPAEKQGVEDETGTCVGVNVVSFKQYSLSQKHLKKDVEFSDKNKTLLTLQARFT